MDSIKQDSNLFLNQKVPSRSKVNFSRVMYEDSVYGTMGISNQHSAGTLMHSVHAYSIGNEKKMPLKPYEGIDSFEY